ncbi:hypothetical protein ACFL47_01805 [Candidatus Latescibacterota bacterium]
MGKDSLITIQEKTIDIDNIEALINFTRYRSHDQGFVEGLELYEDLVSKAGVILFTKDTEITPKRVARLIKIQSSQPKLMLSFRIKKNTSLIDNFRRDIRKTILAILHRRMRSKVYRELLFDVREDVERIIDLFLADDDMTMTVYSMKFVCDCSKIKRSIMFYNQSINVAIFSIAMALSERYRDIIGGSEDKLLDVCKTGIFHNYGGVNAVDKVLDALVEQRYDLYLEANRSDYFELSKVQLGFEVMDAIRLNCEYHMEHRGFLNKEDWTSVLANIVLVAESFLRVESGLFGAPLEPRDVIDQINVRMMNKKYNRLPVQVLTLGMNLHDIFDFYEELTYLAKECLYKTSGVAYPLEGFKSPTLFICKDTRGDCKFLEGSLKAVTLVKPLGELKPGRYHRCWLLTPRLISFYKEHYQEIKKATHEEDSQKKEE